MSSTRICDRTQVTFPDGDSGRVYFNNSGDVYASVTTILGMRDDPSKDAAIQHWKNNNDGQGGSPFHEHIGAYSRWRGTLVHWYLQRALDPDLPTTDEELDSLEAVEDREDEYNFIRSIALNHDKWTDNNFPSMVDWLHQYNHTDVTNPLLLTDILWEDMSWCYAQLADVLPEIGLAKNTFDESHYKTLDTHFRMSVRHSCIIEVEKYLMNHTDNYAGQCDLLYETYDGTTVLADFKTSKRVYWSNKRQLAAYANAIETDPEIDCDEVDEYLIMRFAPDYRDVECSFSSEWDESHDELYDDFMDLNDTVQEYVSDIDFEPEVDVTA